MARCLMAMSHYLNQRNFDQNTNGFFQENPFGRVVPASMCLTSFIVCLLQVKAYQQMQASSSPRSTSPNTGVLRHVATTPGSLENTITASNSENILGGIPIPGKKSSSSNSVLDVGSMSPPAGKWLRLDLCTLRPPYDTIIFL